MDKVSYALGMSMAENMKKSGLGGIVVSEFAKGVEAVLKGEATNMTMEEARGAIQTYFQKMQMEKADKNKAEGEAFLAENAKKEGVRTTASGLQYKVLTEGSGKMPKETDRVKCHYEGRLIDGSVFDSSYRRGEPAVFPVNGVIPGWIEALQMMGEGAKWQLYIPSDLAYGEYGAGDDIAPNSTLIFDVELIEIV